MQRLNAQHPIYLSNATNVSRQIPITSWFISFLRVLNFQVRWCSSSSASSKRNQPEFEMTDAILDAELATNEKLSRFEKPAIQRTHETIMRAGFNAENAFKIIKKCPLVVRHPPATLECRLECWRTFQFTHSQFVQLFVQCPELLEFGNESELRSRFVGLKTFAARTKNVWRLLMASPDILVDRPQVIQAKANYLLEEMKVDVSDAVKSGAFSHSLEKIQCRHMLLVRLGIYKEKKKNASPLDPNKNPRVARIVDTSDSEFAKKICGISMAELNAFYALYRRELEEQREEEAEESDDLTDVEDDGDTSDEEFDPNEKEEYDPRNRNRYNKRLRKPKSKT